MAAAIARAAIRRWSAAMISAPARRASPAVSTIISHATAWLASRSPAVAPIGAWPRGSAAARAMPSRPAPTAQRARDLRISLRPSPTPIIGCRPTASPSPAIISPPASTRRASARGSKAAIASRPPSAGSRPMPRCRCRASAPRATARPISTAAASRSRTMHGPRAILAASSAAASTTRCGSTIMRCWHYALGWHGRMTG